jgi:hypothetical protein
MVSGICHYFSGYLMKEAEKQCCITFSHEGITAAMICSNCSYFVATDHHQTPAEPKPEPEPYNPFDYYQDNPDFLEIV